MKTAIYTFKNKMPLLVEVDEFYFFKTYNEFDKKVSQLCEYDAVAYPADIDKKQFPIVLKIKKLKFGINFEQSSLKDYKKYIEKTKKEINKKIKEIENYE